MLQCLGYIIRIYQIPNSQVKALYDAFIIICLKNNPTSATNISPLPHAWARLQCKGKHFFSLHKTFQEFYFNFFHPHTQHTLTVCPNQQQPSSNLHRRKPTFYTPTHNVYSPGQAKRSSLSGISAQFNQSTSFY